MLLETVLPGLILMLTVGSPRAAERCMLSHLSACTNTNQLMWDKFFQKEIKTFLFRQHGDYAVIGETVPNQALYVLGGPPDSPKMLGKLMLFGACMAHNCGEKGAALLDQVGQIEAIGMLDACNTRERLPDCFTHYTLTVFVRGGGHRKMAIAALSNWATSAIRIENKMYSSSALPETNIDRIQVIDVMTSHRD